VCVFVGVPRGAKEEGAAVANRDLVVVGASAGGVEALIRVVSELPSDFPAAMLVVLHVPADTPSNLPAILGRVGRLPAAHARDDEPIEPGRILVAPPDWHLLVQDGRVRLSSGPFENLNRPAVDVLFRSAAINRDGRTIGVVLSGALDDGAAGLRTIALAGGLAVVQDPGDALIPSMPRSALEAARVDHVLPADEIGRKLPELLGTPDGESAMDQRTKETLEHEVAISAMDRTGMPETPPGSPSVFGCPDCGGVLWEVDHEHGLRFRCRVGHAYTAHSLLAAEDSGLEDALWAALRALEEQESLSRRMMDRHWGSGAERSRTRLKQRTDELRQRADVLRRFLTTPVVGAFAAHDGHAPSSAAEEQRPMQGQTAG
jgi:two-component system, chemotaxis family, protein-glutamate methylesterase/glutaminase